MPVPSRSVRIGAAVAALAAMTAMAGCTAEPEPPVPAPTEPPTLEEAFAGLIDARGVPGGALAIRRGEDTEVFVHGDADDEGTPVTEETVFGYRSVTKSFVVTVLLRLAEEGLVDLIVPTTAPEEGVSPADATPWELAAMTAGTPNYSAQPGLIEEITADPERAWEDDDLFDLVRGLPESFAPGTSYEYSNTNTLLVGELVADASMDTWSQAVAELVIEPLGLESVVYPGDGAAPDAAATPFQLTDGAAEPLPAVRASAFSAAGGLFGTAGDLAAWAQALGTGALLEDETFDARLSAFGPTASDPQSPEYDEYGLGIGRIGDWIGHTGNGLGYQALAMYHAESETAVAILLNATGEDGDLPAHLLEDLEELVLEAP